MDCAACEDKGNPDDKIHVCGVDKQLPIDLKVVNDVVFYIYYYSDRATYDNIAAGCELSFFDPDIVEAKKDFLDIVRDELKNRDKSLAAEVAKVRKGGTKSRASMIIGDIYMALRALGPDIDVKPTMAGKIPNMNPEFMCTESLVTRVNEAEKKLKENEEKVQLQIESLIEENKELRCLLNKFIN